MPLLLALLLACSTDPEPLTCAQDELLDGEQCVPEACGTGTWGDLETDGDTIYVDASAEIGGDGSKESPFTVIQTGLDAQDDKAMVAVAAGTYVENLYMDSDHSGVHLAGRCRELVTIDGSEGDEEDYETGCGIYLDGRITTTWAVSGLTVTAAPLPGILQVRGSLTLDRVAVTENPYHGIVSETGTLVATDCLVSDNHQVGVLLWDTSATLKSVKVLDTQPNASGEWGVGISMESESSLVVSDGLVQGNEAWGINVQEASTLVATDLVIEDNREMGMLMGTSTATLEQTRVLDTRSRVDGALGVGVWVEDSALEAIDSMVQENRTIGIHLSAATVTLDGVQVLDTLPADVYGEWGRGINMQSESTLDMTNGLVQDNYGSGITAFESSLILSSSIMQGNHQSGVQLLLGSTATMHDVQVLETRRDLFYSSAWGVLCQDQSSIVATRLMVSDTDGPGLFAIVNSDLTCTDCTLSHNTFAGAAAQTGGVLVLEDSLIEETKAGSGVGAGLGVFVSDFDVGSSVYQATRTTPHACEPRLTCVAEEIPPPSLSLLNSTIRDNEMGAVYLKGAGSYQLKGNDLSGGPGLDADPGAWAHGDAVFATTSRYIAAPWSDETPTGLLLENNILSDSSGAGLFLDGTTATLSGNIYQDNTTD
ncbi:MAG: right-handed parallel beta-helix repeat-containing protein, partial [Myxococcota bacterium]|nr:right-handed parallel beta-helix repeat-containing protein [Myxococcota bacterium]